MTKRLRTLIVEDEPRSQKALRLLIEKNCPQLELCACCDGVEEAIEAVKEHEPELIFLDIRMPEKNGFDFLDAFPNPSFEVIFVSAYDQYAIQALRRSALDYLLKPVATQELVDAVDRAWQRIEQQASKDAYRVFSQNQRTPVMNQLLALPSREGLEFIRLEEIVKLQADRNYTKVFLKSGTTCTSTHHLKYYEDALPEEAFFRTHHSFIINLQHVKSYVRGEGGYVVLSDGSTADISKRRKKDFLQVFGS